MNVRICGPNLSSPAQQKGDLHVHADGCDDLKHYGRGKKFGGDTAGNQESLVKDASIRKVVEFCYSDHIAESDDVWDSYVSSFWFAPCCASLPYEDEPTSQPEIGTPVYECWVGNQKESFNKLTSIDQVGAFVKNACLIGGPGDMIHVGIHHSGEYS